MTSISVMLKVSFHSMSKPRIKEGCGKPVAANVKYYHIYMSQKFILFDGNEWRRIIHVIDEA